MSARRPLRAVVLLAVVAGVGRGACAASGAGLPLPRRVETIGASPDAYLVPRHDEPAWVRQLSRWVPQRPSTTLGRLLAVVWAIVPTLGGLILGALSWCRPTTRDGVLLFAGVRGVPGFGLRRGGFAATTLGHVVLTRSKTPSRHLMAHELAHTRQAERFGPFMGPLYYYLLARYGYARHPMERAARRAGRAARIE